MKRKVTIIVGLLALLVGINMQVNALTPADGSKGISELNVQVRPNSVDSDIDEWMPDKNLQTALVRSLGLKDVSELTKEALSSYEGDLVLRAQYIFNLKGLEYATNATSLELSLNHLSDITPLSSLAKVKKLNLKMNSDISDLSPLAGMTSLVELDFSTNKVSDVTPLHGLQNLERVTFNYNSVVDLTPLRGMARLKIVEANKVGSYNETLSGEVGQVIKQKNNVINVDGTKPDLVPNGSGAKYGVYDKASQTMEWKYDKAGNMRGESSFNVNSTVAGVIVRFSGQVTQPIKVIGDETSLFVRNTILYVGDQWKPQDNFVSATDKDGNAVDINGVMYDGHVDTTKAGTYKVVYSILNANNEKISKEATVTVKEDKTSLEVKDSQLNIGDKWYAQDNFVKATNKDGVELTLPGDVGVSGKPDTSKPGVYTVTYSVYNHKHEPLKKVATITVIGDQTSIAVKDSTLYTGDEWQAIDNFVKATDADNQPVAFNDVKVEGNVDTSQAGVYKVTYSILNRSQEKVSQQATITVKLDQTNLIVKDSTIYIGDEWHIVDNFVKAVDKDGQAVALKDVAVENNVDINKAGLYTVKYTILNHKNEKVSKEAQVQVKVDQTSLKVKDTIIHVGDTWQAEDNLDEALNQDGLAINIDDILVEGKVDNTREDIYLVKYTITNHKQEPVTETARVTVVANLTSIEVKDSTLYLGDTWDPKDNLVKATDADGKPVGIDKVKVEGRVDTHSEGIYEVKYSLNNNQAGAYGYAKITVKKDETELKVKNSFLYFGDTWNPADNLVKAVDKDGQAIDIKDITVEGAVNIDAAGVNKVKYTILNHSQEKISKVATITVKGEDLTTLQVKGSNLYVNEIWNPQDNIVKALDKDGNEIDIKDIVIDGKVNTAVAKDYPIKFTILNHKKQPVTRATIVKVKEDLTSLEVKDSTLYFGDRWQPEDNLVKATDADGNPLDISDIKVIGNVDIKTAGEYPVTYTILNHAKEEITKVATITMQGHDLTYLEVEDSTLYVGDTWNPADNLIKARDKDGNELGIEDVIVENTVDTSKAGTYEVVYALLNHRNEKLSNIATITVKKDYTDLQVKNSTIYLDDQWTPADNLVKATDQDGNNIDVKDIVVDSNVDTSRTGICKVKYTILNHKGEKITKTATIIVKEDLTKIEVKDSKLYLGDVWQAEDNLVKAIDQDGKAIDIKNVKVIGYVDTENVGVYQVTYKIYNHRKLKVSQTATIQVKEDQSSLVVKDTDLYLNDKWHPADNIVEAIDKDGNVIEDILNIILLSDDNEAKAKVIVEGKVDTSNIGVNKLYYTIFDHANTKITKEVAVNIKLDKTSLEVKDSKINLNSKWNPADNLVHAMDQDGNVLNIKDVTVEGKVNTHKVGKYPVTYTLKDHTDKKISKKATVIVQKENNSNGSGNIKDGNGNLPKTGYDMSIIGSLIGLAGVLGCASLYLSRRERKE